MVYRRAPEGPPRSPGRGAPQPPAAPAPLEAGTGPDAAPAASPAAGGSPRRLSLDTATLTSVSGDGSDLRPPRAADEPGGAGQPSSQRRRRGGWLRAALQRALGREGEGGSGGGGEGQPGVVRPGIQIRAYRDIPVRALCRASCGCRRQACSCGTGTTATRRRARRPPVLHPFPLIPPRLSIPRPQRPLALPPQLPSWKVVLPAKLLQFRPLDLLRVDLFAVAGLVGLVAQVRLREERAREEGGRGGREGEGGGEEA